MNANNQQMMSSQNVDCSSDSGARVLDVSFGNGHGKKMLSPRSGPIAK